MICQKCRNVIADNQSMCPVCKSPIIPQNTEVLGNNLNQSANNNISQNVQGQNNNNENNISNEHQANKIISVKRYLGLILLFSLPIVGLIFLFIKAFDNKENKNISNFAKAQLIYYAIAVVLMIIIYIIVIAGSAYYLLTNKTNIRDSYDTLNPTINTDNTDDAQTLFDGTLIYKNSRKINDIFTYQIPSIFTNKSIDTSLHYTYGDTSIFGDCLIDLNSISNYDSAEELISQMSQYYQGNDLTSKKINNITWHSFILEDSFGKEFYYATDVNDEVYLYQFEINTDDVVDVCSNYHNTVINSFRLK